MASTTPKIDRQTTTPFLLRLFYAHSTFPPLTSFDPSTRLPPSLQIYTWQSCSLRELSTLLLTALPNLLVKPYAGTRIAFRLIFGDMSGRHGTPGRFIARDLGSVVVGENPEGEEAEEEVSEGAVKSVAHALKQLSGEPDKTLGDAKFVIGDYVCCAILPPLSDGSVQPAPLNLPTGPARGGGGGPPARDGFAGSGRDANGFGGRGDFGGYGGRGGGRGGGRFDDRHGNGGVPYGEWRRGEAPPERERERERERDMGGNWRGGGGRGGGGGGRGARGGRW
jgi:histone deacetylase complex subunit SAP18